MQGSVFKQQWILNQNKTHLTCKVDYNTMDIGVISNGPPLPQSGRSVNMGAHIELDAMPWIVLLMPIGTVHYQ